MAAGNTQVKLEFLKGGVLVTVYNRLDLSVRRSNTEVGPSFQRICPNMEEAFRFLRDVVCDPDQPETHHRACTRDDGGA